MTSTSPLPPSATSAVVTGAGRGIGRAIAVELVRLGHAVVVTDVDGDAVRRTAGEIGALAWLVQDVREPQGHRDCAAEARRHGRLAVWVNNPGVGDDGGCRNSARTRSGPSSRSNLLGPIWGSRAARDAFGPEGRTVSPPTGSTRCAPPAVPKS